MRVISSIIYKKAIAFTVLITAILALSASALAQSQAAAADLTGTVTDPNGAVISGATVVAKGIGTGISRTVSSDGDGAYRFIGLPPGEYEITAEAATFKKLVISPVRLTVGQSADLTIKLEVGVATAVVNVAGDDVQLVETNKTSVSNTIDERRIESLPINERSATGFALTISTVGRDNGRPIGPAPTSGLNIGGQRGRSTLVQVDGADFTDNSINASRSTVSQEAVQEFQITTNSYMPEFGRATGGIVNVVTKRGTEAFRGNVFGFMRHKTIQSRNAFAPVIDNDPGKKPPYTRAQYGLTFGGPMDTKNKNFFFVSFEQRRRQESGFFTGDIYGSATQSFTIGTPILPLAQTFTNLTAAQVSYIQAALGSGDPAQIQRAVAYAHLASAGGQSSINGRSTLINFVPGIGVPQGQVVGGRFILSGMPIPLTRNSDGQLVAFRPLAQLSRVFPISENSSFSSFRFDSALTSNHQLSMRLGFNPSTVNGIQDESQNQTLGQNDYSRTGIQKLEDFSFGASLTSIMSQKVVNDLYYNFGRRVAKFDSRVPSIALQIAGTGFIGSNPFSPVNRIERRHQIRDNVTWVSGNHTMKFGGDYNEVSGKARFELNFPGLFNFSQQAGGSLVSVGGVACDSPALAIRCPGFTATQSYGLGFPSVFIQGFGDPNSTLGNKPVAVFGQDSWKVNSRLTLNFGVRYDYEFTQSFEPTPFRDPLTGITLSSTDIHSAEFALNITQGFPRDDDNIAPRLGFAWDIAGNGKTVVRGAIGRFFDHPLLAVSFNSNIADGSQQQQSTLLPIGGPSPVGLLNAFQVFHGTIINCNFPGANPGVNCTPGLAASAQYQNGYMRFDPNTFTGFGPILPFTLHVSKDFQYPDAVQANLSVERMIGRNMSLSVSGIMVNAHHLNHPQDINAPNTSKLRENFRRFAVGVIPGCTAATPTAPSCYPTDIASASFFSIPATSNAAYTVVIPRLIAVNNATGERFVSPVAANFFRPLAPNYFFASALTGGAATKAVFDAQLVGTVRTAGPITAFGDVSAQLSDGNSYYNAMNIELKRRFSSNMQFLATYTWSHSIDDSSDLQTLLKPQNNFNFGAERADSLFDQRHRFVFSGIISAPDSWKSEGGFYRFMHGFSVAPIIEFGSGRPFNILAPGDSNGDFQSTNERPSVLSDGTLCQTGVDAGCFQGQFPRDGNLPRNMGITHNYFSVDARVTRRIRLSERISLDLIGEGFNLFNRFNEAAGNPFYNVVNAYNQRKGSKYYSFPTSAYDPRQFQFGAKLSF